MPTSRIARTPPWYEEVNTERAIVIMMVVFVASILLYLFQIAKVQCDTCCFPLLVTLFYLLALFFIVKDRKRFGQKHNRYVEFGAILYLVGVVLGFFSTMMISRAYSATTIDATANYTLAHVVITEISGITSATALILLIYGITKQDKKPLLHFTILAQVAASMCVIFIANNDLSELRRILVNTVQDDWSSEVYQFIVANIQKTAAPSIIVPILLFLCYYYAHLNLTERKKAQPPSQQTQAKPLTPIETT
ncbi:MAG: hypothetical protein KAT70_05835 [Thermoplasmata archaeon]|nr:hypothetical protein [Thermoplasmata archaeon]